MTPTRGDLIDRLRAVGARPEPRLTPAAAARVDARVAAAFRSGTSGHGAGPGAVVVELPTGRRTWPRRALAATAAVAAVAAGALVWGGERTRPGAPVDPDLALASARNTTVRLPAGFWMLGHAGLELPDGTIVSTGAGGYAEAGGVQLGPGDAAVVADGELTPVADAGVSLPQVSSPPPPTTPLTTPATAPPTTPPTIPQPTLPGALP